MKKLVGVIVCGVIVASCDSFSGGNKERLKAENDSLLMELTQRNAELDEMMGTFNDISEGFRQINAAEVAGFTTWSGGGRLSECQAADCFRHRIYP